MTNFFDPGYVTYRLLQMPDDAASNRRRKVANLLKAYPSAIQFAEQFSQVDTWTTLKPRYGDSKQDRVRGRQIYRVSVRTAATAANQVSLNNACDFVVTITTGPHRFSDYYYESDRGIRKISSADILKREDNNNIWMCYPDRFSSHGQEQTAFYLPWWHAKEPNSAGVNMMSMMFARADDADDYAAFLMKNRRRVRHLSFDEFSALD